MGSFPRRTWLGVWKDLDVGVRRQIAVATLESEPLKKQAVLAIARYDRVRRQTVQKWPVEKQADHLARMRRLPNAQLAAALLTHFHLVRRGEMVTSFLNFLKIPHEGGLIKNIEELKAPSLSRMIAAIRRVAEMFPRSQTALFLDVLSCQSDFEVFGCFNEARAEAFVDAPERVSQVAPTIDSFALRLDAEMRDGDPEAEPEHSVPPDDTPPSFTTLDQMLIRVAVAAASDVHGALSPDKVEDLVEEVIQLNLERQQSHFHRGFLCVLLGRPLELDGAEVTDPSRAWYVCGAIAGFQRRGDLDAVVNLLSDRAGLARELSRPGTGYAERVVTTVFEAFCAKGRFAEAAHFLSAAVVGRSGVELASMVLEQASALIRERREADARRLLIVLQDALPLLKEDPDLPRDFEVILQRRRAHCARLRGDFVGARALLEPQLNTSDAGVRSDIHADLGLLDCGLRSLADVRLPPDESQLDSFAQQFEKGWAQFEKSSEVAAGGRNHGDFCIGMALFARGRTTRSVPHLERAVAGMSGDPTRYGRFGPLDHARLALAVALAEQTDLARVPYARDLLLQVLASRNKAPAYMLRRSLVAFELTDPETAIEVAQDLYETMGKKALPVLVTTRMVRFLPEALDELLEQSKRPEFTEARRFDAAHAVLFESHAMRDALDVEGSGAFRDRAALALDVMIELGHREPFRERLLELLGNENGAWRSALDPLDARVVRAALFESAGQFANAASELSRAFHATLDVDDEWALGKAEALLEDIRALGGPEVAVGLEARLAQYREVFERRSQSGLVVPPSVDPADFYGLVLVIGGNETQAQQDPVVTNLIKASWPNVTLIFERTGWSSNWGEQLKNMDGELQRARVVVLMRYVRTTLGKTIRRRCGELEIPWVSCTGSGRASMVRAIEQAIMLAWRQTGMAIGGE